CDVANGHVFRIEGELVRAVAARGQPGFVDWIQERGAVSPVPGGAVARLIRGERVVQILDSADSDLYRASPEIREIIDRSGVRTTLAIPLRGDRAALGAIV